MKKKNNSSYFNWNENKKRTVLEIKHLKELKSDIIETLKDFLLYWIYHFQA